MLKSFFSVYTRTGDKGTSGLYKYGKRLGKDHIVYDTLGTIDELSCHIGHANVLNDLMLPLRDIQCDLQDINSHIADPSSTIQLGEKVNAFEEWIDGRWKEMPELKNFILASGGEFATRLHLARAVCRRSERCIVRLSTTSPWSINHAQESLK